MQTNITRLQFILRFAAMALPTMRAGDLLNLREDLGSFLGGQDDGDLKNVKEGIAAFLGGGEEGMALPSRGGIVACPLVPPLPLDMTLQDLETLQAEVRKLVTAIGIQGDMTLPGTKTLPIEARYAIVGSRARRTPGWGTHLLVTGPTRIWFG